MSDNPYRITIMFIGQTGAGKSAVGNGYLQIEAFETSESPDSCTAYTGPHENTVNGTKRIVIDTQGLDDTKGLDQRNVQQMVEFLRGWDHGVNAIGIVINGQSPKLDMGTQKLLKLIHVFFNDNNIWNSIFLVFTRWYDGVMSQKAKQGRLAYAEKVRKIARECIGREDVNPQIPCYFVDACEDLNSFDMNTQNEFALIHAFACGKQPISTKDFKVPDVHYFQLFPEYRDNVLISETFSDDEMERTRIFADQTRNRQVAYDGKESYSEWVNTDTRTEVTRKKIEIEFQKEVQYDQKRELKFAQKGQVIIPILIDTRRIVPDHIDVETFYRDYKRTVITDFDGIVSFGEWEITDEYSRKSIEKP